MNKFHIIDKTKDEDTKPQYIAVNETIIKSVEEFRAYTEQFLEDSEDPSLKKSFLKISVEAFKVGVRFNKNKNRLVIREYVSSNPTHSKILMF